MQILAALDDGVNKVDKLHVKQAAFYSQQQSYQTVFLEVVDYHRLKQSAVQPRHVYVLGLYTERGRKYFVPFEVWVKIV